MSLRMFKKKEKKTAFDKGDPNKLYNLLECLGEGTYGTVWTGSNKATGETCAVKIVKIDDDLPEIEQEIMIMKESDSPYVVKFFGAYWAEQERIWMVMEHCSAGSINDLMYVCDITLNVEQVRTTAAAIAMGLKYLHKNLVIHRDIKAGNVLLTSEGHIRLADFGVSAKLKKASDRTTTPIGAPFWMAPEVISETPYDGRADIWSLGITIIELCEGRPPNSHMNAMKALFIIPQQEPPRLKDRELPSDMHDFVKSCLTKNPKKRPSSKQILQHQFIRDEARAIELNDGKSEIMRKLVDSSLRNIEKWRKEEEGEENSTENGNDVGDLDIDPTDLIGPADKTKNWPPPGDHQATGPSVGLSELMPIKKTKSNKSQISGASVELTPLANKFPPPPQSPGSRLSFLNPAKDIGWRKSARENQAPLRDFAQPGKNDGKLKDMSPDDVANILHSDLPANSSQVQAAVMSKNFISSLKVLFRNNPEHFKDSSPENWTGPEIAGAVVSALVSVLANNDDAIGMSDAFKEGMDKDRQRLQRGDNAAATEDLVDIQSLMPDFTFVLGRDGDEIPPPPPSVSSDESDDDL